MCGKTESFELGLYMLHILHVESEITYAWWWFSECEKKTRNHRLEENIKVHIYIWVKMMRIGCFLLTQSRRRSSIWNWNDREILKELWEYRFWSLEFEWIRRFWSYIESELDDCCMFPITVWMELDIYCSKHCKNESRWKMLSGEAKWVWLSKLMYCLLKEYLKEKMTSIMSEGELQKDIMQYMVSKPKTWSQT